MHKVAYTCQFLIKVSPGGDFHILVAVSDINAPSMFVGSSKNRLNYKYLRFQSRF